MTHDLDPKRALLRHALATVAYRGGKAVSGAPDEFADHRFAEGSRAPGEVLAHIGDVLDWALALAQGAHVWRESVPLPWPEEVKRFFGCLERLDAFLASDAPLGAPAEKLFQGPIADALTHIGQIAMLRRAAGSPVRGENYFRADIAAGRVGPDQSARRAEFD